MKKKSQPLSKTAPSKKDMANPMWGGQFSTAPAELLSKINSSIGFDKHLYRQDIEGSIAHAGMLAKQKIISDKDAKEIRAGLLAILKEIEAGKFVFQESLEDIHMNIESALKSRIGDAAGRLHTARSRNDQVAVDFRLYVRGAFGQLITLLKDLQRALVAQAVAHADTIMPGFTHLQTAQPVTLGHHLLAYVEMFGRDITRAQDAAKRLNESPLGAAALAGTSFPIDRHATAKSLGFDRPMANSLDAVSDRDFAMEYLSVASICSVHLSRLAEELINWSSAQFGFVRFSDAFSTGSSIMPQKRNPDAAELVRGKAGRVIGHLMGLLTTMKALPLAYNKDMQEDKEPVFDAAVQMSLTVAAMAGMIKDATFDKAAMRKAAEYGYSTATDLADWLVQNLGMPFRDAHHVAAKTVKFASAKKKMLHELSLKELQSIEPRITKGVLSVLTVEQSVASRISFGGTAPANVKKAAAAWKKALGL